jgi:hypothetical protein
MAREEDCGEHGKNEVEMAAGEAVIEFPIQSPFKGGFGKGRATVRRVAPWFRGQGAKLPPTVKLPRIKSRITKGFSPW